MSELRIAEFTVFGTPVAQGSFKAINSRTTGRPIVVPGNKHELDRWRTDVAAAAHDYARIVDPFHGPVSVTVSFRFPMPASRRKWEQLQGWIPKVTTPDLDKLCRALGDALVAGGLIGDDSQIVQWAASKIEVHADWTGAAITVREVATRAAVPTERPPPPGSLFDLQSPSPAQEQGV